MEIENENLDIEAEETPYECRSVTNSHVDSLRIINQHDENCLCDEREAEKAQEAEELKQRKFFGRLSRGSSESSFRVHQPVAEQPAKNVCDMCGEKFDDRDDMLRHKRLAHPKSTYYECDKCRDMFWSYDELQHHRATYHQTQEYQLLPRKRVNALQTSAKSKRRRQPFRNADDWSPDAVDSGKPLECDICNKKFMRAGNYRGHMLEHTEVRRFECYACSKKFDNLDALRAHKRTHMGDLPFQCDICDATFLYVRDLHAHKRTQHEQFFECDICRKVFTRAAHLQDHMQLHPEHRPHKCDQCGRGFLDLDQLIRHRRTHAMKELPYECDVCHKRFKLSGNLRGHMQHHDENYFGEQKPEHTMTDRWLNGVKNAIDQRPDRNRISKYLS